VRRSRRSASRERERKLASDAGALWARVCNVDHLVAARMGWLVPAFALRRSGDGADGRAASLDLGRRVVVPPERHAAGLAFASTFWLVSMSIALLGFAAVVCGVGIVDHRLVGSGPVAATAAALIGWMGLSMSAAGFAGIRHRNLFDPVVRRWSGRDIPGSATPKPYDSVASLVAGFLAALVFWAGIHS
jgi:hypothetical protein